MGSLGKSDYSLSFLEGLLELEIEFDALLPFRV